MKIVITESQYKRILKEEEDFIPLEDLITVIKDYQDGFDVFIMNKDEKIGEISFAKESLPNVYTIVDATIDDEYKGNRIYAKTIINLFKERPNIIINSLFRSPEANKAWIYLLNNLPPNIGKSVKYYKDEDTTLFQLKLKNLQEQIPRIQSMMGIISEVRGAMLNYLIDKGKEITGIDWPEYVIKDWMYKKTTRVKELLSMFSYFMERFGKGHWEFQNIDLSLESFTGEDQEILKRKMGGYINTEVPDDEERHQRQQSRLDKMGVSSEPVIVALKKDGKYDLIEGWHRTTASLKKFGSYKQNAWVYILD